MHTLTIGRTETGKTRLQQLIAQKLYNRGAAVLVCDPLGASWPAHRQFWNLSPLVELAKRTTCAQIFVDESGQTVDATDPSHAWLATTARHSGHSVHFIAQRHTQLPPNIRDQCARLYCFRVGADDARQLANTWAADELRTAAALGAGEFILVSGTAAQRFKLNFRTGKITQNGP